MAFEPFTAILNLANTAVDKIWPDADAESKRKFESLMADVKANLKLAEGQQQINAVEAAHKSVFVSGWRPFVGWACGAGIAYQFVLYPFLCWCWALLQSQGIIPQELGAPPELELGTLVTLLTGMLGMGGLRTYEKKKGVARHS